jgi:solute carrier family 30 (zinc transporter), member 2
LYKFSESDNSDAELSRIKKASIICITFMLVEIIGGLISNSLAILSDAAHMATDQMGLFIQVLVIFLSRRKQTAQMSYGYHRADIIGALLGVFTIWFLTYILVVEAVERFEKPQAVEGWVMILIAVLGLVANLVMLQVLGHAGHGHGGHGHSHGGHGHDGEKEKEENEEKEVHLNKKN